MTTLFIIKVLLSILILALIPVLFYFCIWFLAEVINANNPLWIIPVFIVVAFIPSYALQYVFDMGSDFKKSDYAVERDNRIKECADLKKYSSLNISELPAYCL